MTAVEYRANSYGQLHHTFRKHGYAIMYSDVWYSSDHKFVKVSTSATCPLSAVRKALVKAFGNEASCVMEEHYILGDKHRNIYVFKQFEEEIR